MKCNDNEENVMHYINSSNLSDYAFLNEDTLVFPLKAVCICFHGYTDATMLDKSNNIARVLGKNGIAWVFPYYSVWAWMSKSSQIFNEQVIDAVYERLGADSSVPLIVSGGSMGGLTALNYLVYGKREAIGCAVNCPVTDMVRIFEDKPSFRRAILSAHIDNESPLDEILASYSPVRFAKKLPDIPYFLVFGESDTYFTQMQMPPLIEKLKELDLRHTLLVQPGMNHCDIEGHPEALRSFCDFIVSLTDA